MLPYVLKVISRSIASEHFQVVERTLYLWNNEVLAANIFGQQYAHLVFPRLHPLLRAKENHWNPTVKSLADEVVRLFKRVDGELWARLELEAVDRRANEERRRARREANWDALKRKHVSAVANGRPVVMTSDAFVQPPDAPMSQLTLEESAAH